MAEGVVDMVHRGEPEAPSPHGVGRRAHPGRTRPWLPLALAGVILLSYIGYALAVHHPVAPEREGIPVLAHWDGAWYHDIAEFGYRGEGGTTNPAFRPEFFPLFPALAAGLHAVAPFLSLTAAGVTVNVVLVLVGVGLVDRTVSSWPLSHRCLLAAFLVTIPNAFFFVCFFAEASLACCAAVVIWGVRTPSRLPWAAAGAAVGTLARPVGFLLAVPVVVSVLMRRRADAPSLATLAIAASGVPVLLAVYKVFAGSPIAFVHAQFSNPEWREGVLGGNGWSGMVTTVREAFVGPGFERFGSQPIGVLMVVLAVAFGLLAWRWDRALSIGALVLAVGPLWFQAITALARYLVPCWFAWVGGFAALQRRRSGLAVVAALTVAGFVCNIQLLDRFTRWSFVG